MFQTPKSVHGKMVGLELSILPSQLPWFLLNCLKVILQVILVHLYQLTKWDDKRRCNIFNLELSLPMSKEATIGGGVKQLG